MDSGNLKELVSDFIKRHPLGVLATVSPEGKPEAAVITIALTDAFEIIFETFRNYRKYENLRRNRSVAVVVGWDSDITVQYEGTARELADNELKKGKEEYFQKHPGLRKWDNLPEMAWFKVTPAWVRYLDNNTDPRTTHEITF